MRSLVCSALGGAPARRYHNDSAACDALLNLTAWGHDEFLARFAGSSLASLLSRSVQNDPDFVLPPSLLELHMHMTGEAALPGEAILQRPDEDALLWSGPSAPAWVACSQQNQTCYGKIPKDVWYDPNKRAPACLGVFNEQIRLGHVKSTAVGVDICNLNGRTNALCQVGWRGGHAASILVSWASVGRRGGRPFIDTK